jgi:formiminotetrahydrofolate cyclodeaminase
MEKDIRLMSDKICLINEKISDIKIITDKICLINAKIADIEYRLNKINDEKIIIDREKEIQEIELQSKKCNEKLFDVFFK